MEFFDNLKSIRDATGEKVAYVFTSFRKFAKIFPTSNYNELISRFVSTEYIKPLIPADQKVILHNLLQKYHIPYAKTLEETILSLSGGHVQYIHLCVLIAHELFDTRNHISSHLLKKEIQEER